MSGKHEASANYEWLAALIGVLLLAILVFVFSDLDPSSTSVGTRLAIAVIPELAAVIVVGLGVYAAFAWRGISPTARRDAKVVDMLVDRILELRLGDGHPRFFSAPEVTGVWDSTWTVEGPANYAAPISDNVSLVFLKDHRVVGMGENEQAGRYVLTGFRTDYGLSLVYRDAVERLDYVGAVVLDRATPETMQGRWVQFPGANARVLLQGTVRMKRRA